MAAELPKWLRITSQVKRAKKEEIGKCLGGLVLAYDLKQQLEHNEIRAVAIPLSKRALEHFGYWRDFGCDSLLRDIGNVLRSNNIDIRINLKNQQEKIMASVELSKFRLKPQKTIYDLVWGITTPHYEHGSIIEVEPKAKLGEIQFGEIVAVCTKSRTATRMPGGYSNEVYSESRDLFTLRMRSEGFFVSKGRNETPQQISGNPKNTLKDQLEKALDRYISGRI